MNRHCRLDGDAARRDRRHLPSPLAVAAVVAAAVAAAVSIVSQL